MDERLRDGVVIRPSLLGLQAAMTVLACTGGGIFVLVTCIVEGLKQQDVGFVPLDIFAVAMIIAPYFILGRHFVFIGDDVIAHGWRRDKPSEIAKRAEVSQVWWGSFDAMGNRGRLYAADGKVLMTFQPIITGRQMKKIARLLDKPFNQPFVPTGGAEQHPAG